MEKIPKQDLLVITEDLNAKVGSDVEGFDQVMVKHRGTTMARNYTIFAA